MKKNNIRIGIKPAGFEYPHYPNVIHTPDETTIFTWRGVFATEILLIRNLLKMKWIRINLTPIQFPDKMFTSLDLSVRKELIGKW